MKIVYCVPELYNPGGMERVLTQKANYLASELGYDVTIITTEQKNRDAFFSLNEKIKLVDFGLNFDNHYNKNLFLKFILHHYKLRLYKKSLEKFLRKNAINVCVSLCGKEIEFLGDLKDCSIKIAEIHFAKDSRKHFFLARKSGKIWEWLGDIRTNQLVKSTQKLEKLIVLTKEDLNRWSKTNSNIIQIYNPSPIVAEMECSDVTKNKRFIAVGKLDAQKGFDYLISAWKLVARKHSDWKLDIFGQGQWQDMLTSMIKEAGLEGIVNLKGVSDNIMKEYLSSSAYVMSSRYEGFPMVLLEAISCGLPIVSFDCESGPNEIIKDGENGFLVAQGDIEQLAYKICEMIENDKLRVKMGFKSKEFSKNYEFPSIMEQWKALFESLIKM